MLDFRCYLVNEQGFIVGVETFGGPNDDAALAWATGVLKDRKKFPQAEIWQLDRRLGLLTYANDQVTFVSASAPSFPAVAFAP